LMGLQMATMNQYRSPYGQVVTQGIIENPTDEAVTINEMAFSYLNDEGAIVHVSKTTSGPGLLQPRARAPWMTTANADTPEFSAVRVNIKASPRAASSNSHTQEFSLADEFVSRPAGQTGAWSLSGQITNRGNRAATLTQVHVAVFGHGGELLRVGSTFASMNRLEPGEGSPFKVTIQVPDEIARYEVLVQGFST
jgi:hypothetical protein